MSLAYYMDEHIPRAVAEQLELRGIDVLTVQQDGQTGLADPLVPQRAYDLRRLVVTQDEDYKAIAAKCWADGTDFFGISFVDRYEISLGTIITDLELLAKCTEVDEIINQIAYIPLK